MRWHSATRVWCKRSTMYKKLEHCVPEATVCNYKKHFQGQHKESKNVEDISVKAISSPGHPLLLPKLLDDLTKQLVLSVCVLGHPFVVWHCTHVQCTEGVAAMVVVRFKRMFEANNASNIRCSSAY